MEARMGVIAPRGLPVGEAHPLSRPLGTLKGATIGEVYNNHFKGELMFRTYRRLFDERCGGVRIVPFEEFPTVYVGGDAGSQKRIAKEIAALAKARGCDAIISGNGG